jgi:hypothetical protein
MKTLLLLTFTAALMWSCATPYASNGYMGGYSDTALAPDVYKISFEGNGYTTKLRTSDFAVLRAAELTLSHGYRYFGIINQNEGGYTTFQSGTSTFFFPESGLMIHCFNEQPQAGFALDAQFISHSIRTKYNLRTS